MPVERPQRLMISGVIAAAEAAERRIVTELPAHQGLAGAAKQVVAATREAERVSRELKRPWSLHRLPAVFLAAAVLILLLWTYWRFFHVSTVSLAIPDRDASELRERTSGQTAVRFQAVETPGSREAVDLASRGDVDLAFVQGGMPLPRELLRLETPSPELVLWMTRAGVSSPGDMKRVLTSVAGEGSHTVALDFLKAWQAEGRATFLHDWRELTANPAYVLPDDVDGVFVVKDPADEKTLVGVQRLAAAGFRLRSPDIGVRHRRLDYLNLMTIPAGYLGGALALPPEPVATYSVKTFLVARPGLSPRLLAVAAHVFDRQAASIQDGEFSPTASDASELFQGIEAFLGIIVNLGLAFLALLGLEITAYRKRFHELNSLISLLSMLQSNKDLLGVHDPALRADRLLYLGQCSDLLGLVSTIGGYYAQENSSLLFNNLPEVIHQRCDSLKINIQLKILHATIELPAPVTPKEEQPSEPQELAPRIPAG